MCIVFMSDHDVLGRHEFDSLVLVSETKRVTVVCGLMSRYVALRKRWSGLINIPRRAVIVMCKVGYMYIIQDTKWVSGVGEVDKGGIGTTHSVRDGVCATRIILTKRCVIIVMLVISVKDVWMTVSQ